MRRHPNRRWAKRIRPAELFQRPPQGSLPGYYQLEADPDRHDVPTPDQKHLFGDLNNAARALQEGVGNPDRADYMSELNAVARTFLTGAPLGECLTAFGMARGRYDERLATRERERQRQERQPKVVVRTDGKDTPVDLQMELQDDLSPEQAELVVEVRKAVTVISVVFTGRRTDSQRQGDYIRKLHDIASYGLASRTGAVHALRALDNFRDEFVAREASAVKNQYINRLGLRAAGFAFAFLLLYVLGSTVAAKPNTGFGRFIFGDMMAPRIGGLLADPLPQVALLAFGASLGAWLSFSLRRPILGFSDLAMLEEDRLNPTARIVFVVGLTVVVGLLIHTKLLSIKVGDIDVDLGKALLLGLLCGIAERALASAVSRRATDVVDRVDSRPMATVPATPAMAASAAPARAPVASTP